MKEKERGHFEECINMVLKSQNYKKNFLMIKHNNVLSIKRKDVDDVCVFHQYRTFGLRNPYEPFLDIIKSFLRKKQTQCTEYSIEEFLEKAKVYPLHKKIFLGYFESGVCERQEELLLGEYLYEKEKFQKAILNMISEIAKEDFLCIVLDEINLAGTSAIWMLEEIITRKRYNHIKVVAVFNEEGEVFPFVIEKLKRFVQKCEEAGLVYNWIYEEEIEGQKVYATREQEIPINVRLLKNMFYTLECELAAYYLKIIFERTETQRIFFETKQEMELLKVFFWVSLVEEEFSYALYLCDRLAKLEFSDEEVQKKEKIEIEALKTLVYIYNGNRTQSEAGLLACKEVAKGNTDDKLLFKVALLENMAKYSGWRNLWISEEDTEVSQELIQKCEEYGYLNHLAHIYVYSFNSDYRNFETIETMGDGLKEFYQGIELGQKLKNEQFLVDAYRKNIMIASVHGHFNVCIYFYKKNLEVVKQSKNELEEAGIYNGLGYSNCGLEKYNKANTYYNKALILYYKNEMSDEIVETLYNLGINAMLAGDYKNASSYLLSADSILHMLKQSTMKTCNISKLFGLIALANFRQGSMYHVHLYLNKAKQFLAHILGKQEEEVRHLSDDSLFLIYFVSGLLKKREKNYEAARERFVKAELYMRRSTGGMFFNYPEFVFDYYHVLNKIGREAEARKVISEFEQYCKTNQYYYRLQKIKEVLGKKHTEIIEFPEMVLQGITMEELNELIRKQSGKKERASMVRNIRFFNILQKFTNHMTRTVKEEMASILPVFKDNFSVDKVFLIRCKKSENEVIYNDLGYQVSQDKVDFIVNYFKKNPRGFVVSKDGMKHEGYAPIVSCFDEERIFSFVAVPISENNLLNSIFIAYIEIKDNWTSSKSRSILTDNDLEIFTYVFCQISNAIEKLEVEKELTETNEKLKEQMEQVLELKNDAEVANEAKSNFLANMSHEIRTPMNAIIGMAEIALHGELSKEQKGNIEQIKSSGTTLLSIINDILDFSKIESGKMNIIVEKYQPMSIVQDVVNIIVSRIGNKDIEFILDIDASLPYELLGDSIRIKQIIINLANNAVKFTKEGMVKLKITYERSSQDEIQMQIVVEDTGIGIKDNDVKKLFQAFQQVDSKRNRNIEGTGLGLSITKQLLRLMDGDIKVESEYGKGSVFSCTLPQKIVTEKKRELDLESIKSVIYIENLYVREQLEKDLGQMNAAYQVAYSEAELLEIITPEIKYLFVEYELCSEKILQFIERNPELTGVMLVGFYSSETYPIKNLVTVKKPLYSFDLEKVFRREELYGNNYEEDTKLDFIAPKAEILIVDDNAINLRVAEGLLEPLQMRIDTATSGKEVIDKISIKMYDIIFMDHMMPEVDGVETTHIIRRFYENYKDVPIIALTANAVAGTREMFLNEGMNDFVAKPIELKILIAKIRHWLPKEKLEKIQESEILQKEKTSIEIEGIDADYAVSLLGEEKLFWLVLKDYYDVIEKKIKAIQTYEETESWKEYTIEVHALKSASRQIGALELAEKAERMEKAGNEKDGALIHKCTPEMLEQYRNYQKIFEPYFRQEKDQEAERERKPISPEILSQLFGELREAMRALDLDKMDEAMARMEEYEYVGEQQELFGQLQNAVQEIDTEACENILLLWEEKN